MILITGATGNVGSELLKKLPERGEGVRAFVRNRAKTQSIAPAGVEFVEGDFTKPETFSAALEGVDRLFLLIPSSAEVEQQQRNFVDAAQRQGVKQIVKLSQLGADKKARGRFQRYHGAVENYILKSGIPYTFLRPNLFMQGLLNFRSAISSQSAIYAPAGNARVSVVDVRDVAAIAAKALTETGHEGKSYEITGLEALTHADMAERLSLAMGRPIKYVDVPPKVFKDALLGFGVPPWQASGLVEDYEHYRHEEASRVTPTVFELTGNKPITFFQFAQDYSGIFLAKAAGAP